MAIHPTVRSPVLERTSAEGDEGGAFRPCGHHEDKETLTFDLGPSDRGVDTHQLWSEISWVSRWKVDGRYGTSKHCESPVEDCLATCWWAETYEDARMAVRAN